MQVIVAVTRAPTHEGVYAARRFTPITTLGEL